MRHTRSEAVTSVVDASDGGSRSQPRGEDGLPEWFPAQAPRDQNSAVLLGFSDGAVWLCAMSGAGEWGMHVLSRCGYDLSACSFDSVTAGGRPIVEYREIRIHGVEPGPEHVAELGRLLRRHGVVAHAYAAYEVPEAQYPLRFQQVGGTTAFPDLSIIHRVEFSHGLGVHHFGHPRQLAELLRRVPEGAEGKGTGPHQIPAEGGWTGAMIMSSGFARQIEQIYQQAGGAVHFSAFEFQDLPTPTA